MDSVPNPPARQYSPYNFLRFLLALVIGLSALLFWLVLALILVGVMSAVNHSNTCNVARIQIHGILTTTDNGFTELLGAGSLTSTDSIIDQLQRVTADDSVRAVVLDVDSPGGTPVAGDELMQAIASMDKPTVAVVRDLGTSAAYWAIAGADRIIASPVSEVGSIGVTMSYLEEAGAKEKEGSRWVGISSGTFKDAGNPDRPLAKEEQAYFQDQVDTVHEYMVHRIVGVRGDLNEEDLTDLADGRAFLGSEALGRKLVDALGGFTDALAYIEDSLGMSAGDAVLCAPEGSNLQDLLR